MKFNVSDFGKCGFLGFICTAIIVAVLAYTTGGRFSFGIISADFSEETSILTKKIETQQDQINVLENKNKALKTMMSATDLEPVLKFEIEIDKFTDKYGEVKTSWVDTSCENDDTKQLIKLKRELKILEGKALNLNLYDSYDSFFNSFKGGTFNLECRS
ncbi:hypothetical protein [Shewanella surugensis]|uniref:Uncharacterized protein n=1 Tax=Shewanella surugensis TaxID=212020 RepID=A0ABT0LHV4_9GAMM|nr:hypothetical protein [Shewanella surugensis]MCL1127283.1 hypothetical protein [Shewanella surugensis]